MTIMKFFAFYLFASLMPLQASADLVTDVRNDARFGRVLSVVISGTITADDRDALIATQEDAVSADLRMVVLGSGGGDLNAAMAMGR
jgi:hypothetical protein